MTSVWSYEADLPTDKDKVRLLIGDTDTSDKLLSDSEVEYFITTHGSLNRAASEACRAIAAMFARQMSRSVGGLQADFSAKHRQYLSMAENLDANQQLDPVSPFVSGYSKAAKAIDFADDDRENLAARKGIHDNPRVGPLTGEDYGVT